MRHRAVLAAAAFSSILFSVNAQQLPLTVDSGQVVVTNTGSGLQRTVGDTATIGRGDSLQIPGESRATLRYGSGSRLLLKGPGSVSLAGDSAALVVTLDEGQIFMDRKAPFAFRSVTIAARGYSFEPVGTAAAVKTTRQGVPTTAVLRGAMRMKSPSGEALEVPAGSFGSADPSGKLTKGKLSERAIGSLESWSGVTHEVAAPVAETPVEAGTAPDETGTAAATAPPPEKTEAAPTTQAAPQAPAPPAAAAAPRVSGSEAAPEGQAKESKDTPKAPAASDKQTPPPASPPGGGTPMWEIGAGSVTVDDEQWTRLAVGVDVPIWKFGIFFDVELFINNDGQFSDKGWDFRGDWVEAVTRKVRYVRFGQEPDPLFVKVGGLSSVGMGYGFIVDRFTNMLHYPDQKLIGLQFCLNDLTPVGLSVQTMFADFLDLRNDGGLGAARLAVKPLKMTGIPLVQGIEVGATYALDRNQFAPARDWSIEVPATMGAFDDMVGAGMNPDTARAIVTQWFGDPDSDRVNYQREVDASEAEDPFSLVGADIGVPIVRTSLLSVDVYAQAGFRADSVKGWGIGAPGVSVKVWRLWGNVEYRRVQGKFTPGYFGPYYLDERLVRTPDILTKEERLGDDTLNGVFGRLGFNVANVLVLEGSYQYMVGSQDTIKDQRFEATGSLGDLILDKIPKLNKAEVYFYKTNIGSEPRRVNGDIVPGKYDHFFDETRHLYYGYRAGFEITPGASLIWDTRYGFRLNNRGRLEPTNNVSVQTAITF